MPRVFAPTAFRWTDNVDYPYGWQDIPDDSKARAMKLAGKVVDGVVDTADDVTSVPALQALVSGAGKRMAAVRLATFGDSTGDLNPTVHDITKIVGVLGGSTSGLSPERFHLPTHYPVAYAVGNGGIGGQTTSQMLARASVASGTGRKSIQDIIDLRPDVVLLRAGINDLASLNAGNFDATVATTIANRRAIVQAFVTAGILVIDEGIYAYSATGHLNPTLTRQAILQINAAAQADAAVMTGQVEWIDWRNVVSDSSANWLTNCSQNDANFGLHPSFYGAYLIAQKEAAILTKYFGVSAPYRYRGPNLLKSAANGTFGNNSLGLRTAAGVGGGLRPEGWTQGANGNITQTLSLTRTVSGKQFWTTKGTGTAANNQLNNYWPLDAANFAPVAGDIYGLEFGIYVSDGNGGPPPTLKTHTARFNLFNTVPQTTSHTHNQNGSALTAPSFPGPYIGYVVFQPYEIPASIGTLSGNQEFWSEWITDSIQGWELGFANPRLVKIGSGGVLDSWQV